MINITQQPQWPQWLDMALSLDRNDPILTLEAIGPSIFAAGQAEAHQRALQVVAASAWQHGGDDMESRAMDRGAIHQIKATTSDLLAMEASPKQGDAQ